MGACFGVEVKKSCPKNSHKAKFMKNRAICSRMNSQATTRRVSLDSPRDSPLCRMPSLSELPEMAEDAVVPRKRANRQSIQARVRRASSRRSPRTETAKAPPLTDVKVAACKLRYLGSTKSATTEKIAKVVKPQCRLALKTPQSVYKCAYVGTIRDSQSSDASLDTDACVPFMNNATMTSSAKSTPQLI